MAKIYLLPDDSPPRPKPKAVLRRFQSLKTSAIFSHLHGYYLLTQVDKHRGKAGLLLPSAEDDDWDKERAVIALDETRFTSEAIAGLVGCSNHTQAASMSLIRVTQV